MGYKIPTVPGRDEPQEPIREPDPLQPEPESGDDDEQEPE
jgi:hypothetical protein